MSKKRNRVKHDQIPYFINEQSIQDRLDESIPIDNGKGVKLKPNEIGIRELLRELHSPIYASLWPQIRTDTQAPHALDNNSTNRQCFATDYQIGVVVYLPFSVAKFFTLKTILQILHHFGCYLQSRKDLQSSLKITEAKLKIDGKEYQVIMKCQTDIFGCKRNQPPKFYFLIMSINRE